MTEIPRIKEMKNMTTHIIFGKFSQDGIKNIKDSPKRLEAARKVVESVGGTLKAF